MNKWSTGGIFDLTFFDNSNCSMPKKLGCSTRIQYSKLGIKIKPNKTLLENNSWPRLCSININFDYFDIPNLI